MSQLCLFLYYQVLLPQQESLHARSSPPFPYVLGRMPQNYVGRLDTKPQREQSAHTRLLSSGARVQAHFSQPKASPDRNTSDERKRDKNQATKLALQRW